MAVLDMKIMQATFATNCLSMQTVVMPLLLLQLVNAMSLVPPLAPQ